MDPSFTLRSGASGPVVTGTPGDVLTFDAPDGRTLSGKRAGALPTANIIATGPSTTVDYTAVRSVHVAMQASTTFAFVWPAVSMVVVLRLIQALGGGFVPTFPAEVKFPGGAPPAWTMTAGHWDELAIDWDGTTGTVSFGLNYGP